MDRCPKQQSWTSYWRENMEALGLPTSSTVYGTQTLMAGSISSLVNVSARFGPRVTVWELVKAGSKVDAMAVVFGMSASWYLGAAVGSAAVATGRHLGCGTQIIDVISYAARHQMLTPRISAQLVAHPEIYDASRRNRFLYGHMAKSA